MEEFYGTLRCTYTDIGPVACDHWIKISALLKPLWFIAWWWPKSIDKPV